MDGEVLEGEEFCAVFVEGEGEVEVFRDSCDVFIVGKGLKKLTGT